MSLQTQKLESKLLLVALPEQVSQQLREQQQLASCSCIRLVRQQQKVSVLP
ncbi:hypothetical protein GCM10011507_06300 [Edaphobacter acidisoli]|uniref:Uncharacterized protein n=1 Tax=Edaphobacter acidisoli TaxID=2040573 RepID=A0A916RIZ5_9BACT|nr:hypothetical protein [Edaphobacter acidisoli]GGA57683.1 hypothetical protein GCM10011507_06300 [Edaphobacter acidisoli]